MTGTATIVGPYRYDLTRRIDGFPPSGRRLLVVMINPSTADATTNDHTITKLEGFAKLWGYGELVVVNLFAYRAQSVRDLKAALKSGRINIVGEDNDRYIRAHAREADDVLISWGALAKIPKAHRGRPAEVLEILKAAIAQPFPAGSAPHASIFCLGRTKCGQPCHPLTLAYATPRERIDAPARMHYNRGRDVHQA